MVCAHHHRLRDKASAGLRRRYLPMPSLAGKRVPEKTPRSLELINEIGINHNFKKCERLYANRDDPDSKLQEAFERRAASSAER